MSKISLHIWLKNWATVTEFIVTVICQNLHAFRDKSLHEMSISANFNIKRLLRSVELKVNQKLTSSSLINNACAWDLRSHIHVKDWETQETMIQIWSFNNQIVRLSWVFFSRTDFAAAASWAKVSEKIAECALFQFLCLITIEFSRAAWQCCSTSYTRYRKIECQANLFLLRV